MRSRMREEELIQNRTRAGEEEEFGWTSTHAVALRLPLWGGGGGGQRKGVYSEYDKRKAIPGAGERESFIASGNQRKRQIKYIKPS